jgi:hypothetical protein
MSRRALLRGGFLFQANAYHSLKSPLCSCVLEMPTGYKQEHDCDEAKNRDDDCEKNKESLSFT